MAVGDEDLVGTLRLSRPQDVGGRQALLDAVHQGLFGTEGQAATLDRYTLVREVGAGGGGLVYEAYDPKLDRKVALKLVRDSSTGGAEAQARLMREARALARLNHPNIVAVYDAGPFDVAAAGSSDQPNEQGVFISMELVDGTDLRKWATNRPWRQIVQALIDAARGLIAAHEAGLIHRDFKPGNVLVSADGRVKVLDFGLVRPASASDDYSDSSGSTTERTHSPNDDLTQAGTVMGTPRYMAPEQHAGEPATAAADQYALCATAWELVFDVRAFPMRGLDALAKAKRAGPPAPPRGLPRWLGAALRTGLAPDPEDRHRDLVTLVGVLERGLGRRRRVTLAAGGLVALTAAGATMLVTRPDPCDVSAEVDGVWDRATRDAVRRAFEETGVPYANKAWEQVDGIMARRMTRWAELRRDVCLVQETEEPRTDDALTLGCLDLRLAETRALAFQFSRGGVPAVENAAAALAGLAPVDDCLDTELVRLELGPAADAAPSSDVLALRSELQAGNSAVLLGQYDEALAIVAEVESRAQAMNLQGLAAEAQFTRGAVLAQAGRFREAEARLEQAVIAAEKADATLVRAKAMTRLVFVTGRYLERLEDGLRWSRLAAAVLERHDDPEVRAQLATLLGATLAHHGRPAEGLEQQDVALSLLLPRREPTDVAVLAVRNRRAIALKELKRLDEAATAHREILAARESTLGPQHPLLAQSLNNLGETLQEMGKFAEAEAFHRQALAIRQRSYGPNHYRTMSAVTRLAAALAGQGRVEEAVKLYQQALRTFVEAYGADDPRAADVRAALQKLQGAAESPHGDSPESTPSTDD